MQHYIKNASLGLSLTGMITATLHGSAQQLTENAYTGMRAHHLYLHEIPNLHLAVTQGQYSAYNSGGEPGIHGVVIGLSVFAALYFVLSRVFAFKPTPKIARPVSPIPQAHQSSRSVETSEIPAFTAPLRTYASPSSQAIVSNGN